MAKGDNFAIQLKYQYGEIAIPGICNSDLINENEWNNDQIGKISNVTFEQAVNYISGFLGTDTWKLLKMPFYPSNTPGVNNALLEIFPSSYPVGEKYPDGLDLMFGELLVPDNKIYTIEYSTYIENIGSGQNAGSLIFPYPNLYCQLNGENIIILGSFIVASDNFVENGVINDVSNVRYCGINLNLINGNWQGVIYGRGDNSPTINQFWVGKELPDYGGSDPFEPGGDSSTGGGGGSFDNNSVPIEIPNLPSISASSTGFISLFNPTLTQLNELSSYLWSDLFNIDGWKKLFADPMDAILGLSILPVAIPSSGQREVKVGNIGTGISMNVASSQFVTVDCGSITVNEYWGAYLDYEPYTQAQIFLPYIGTRPISVDEIMGKTVQIVYNVDILTGACCCFVKCGDSVLYTYNGQCSIPIPITGANYTSVVNGVISIAASVGSLVATGGASAPTAIPAIASSAINQMKPSIEKSGSISGSAGVLNMQTPYLILIRPRQALPSKQNEFIGYPSLITVQLTELSGYTEVQSIHLENIPATQEELAEIQSLLEGGVIF